jgi:CRP/FNR family transcriptional regulator, cyclic AMP receptor protein
MDQSHSSEARLALDNVVLPSRLREIGVFGGMSEEMLLHLSKTLPVQRMPAGECVFREGDAAREMFVLLDGELEVLKKSRRGRETRVAILGPSDAFGEMSILDLQPRSATLRALSPIKLIRVSTEEMDAIYRHDVKAYALMILNIARDLSRRLRVADGLVAQVTATMIDEYGGRRT